MKSMHLPDESELATPTASMDEAAMSMLRVHSSAHKAHSYKRLRWEQGLDRRVAEHTKGDPADQLLPLVLALARLEAQLSAKALHVAECC